MLRETLVLKESNVFGFALAALDGAGARVAIGIGGEACNEAGIEHQNLNCHLRYCERGLSSLSVRSSISFVFVSLAKALRAGEEEVCKPLKRLSEYRSAYTALSGSRPGSRASRSPFSAIPSSLYPFSSLSSSLAWLFFTFRRGQLLYMKKSRALMTEQAPATMMVTMAVMEYSPFCEQ